MIRVVCAFLVLAAVSSTALFAAPNAGAERGADVPPVAHDPAFARSVRTLLETGFERGRDSLENARRQVRLVPSGRRDDSVLLYAWGLVLLRQLKYSDAIEQFEKAADAVGRPYLPAWRALIWGRMMSEDYEAGLERLVEYARIMERADSRWPDAETRREGARWIGRVLAALDKLDLSDPQRELLLSQQREIDRLLTLDRREACLRGRGEVDEHYARLTETKVAVKKNVAAQQKAEKKQEQKSIAAEKKRAEKKRESLQMTAEQWKKWLEDRVAELEKELGVLEKQYAVLEDRLRSVQRSRLLVQQEMYELSLRESLNSRRRRRSAYATPEQIAYAERSRQLLQYNGEYNNTLAQMHRLRQQAARLIAQHRADRQRFEQATGQIAKENAALQKWDRRLKEKEKELLKQPVGTSARTRSIEKRARSFKTYVPLDVEAEKDRLLEALKPPGDGPP